MIVLYPNLYHNEVCNKGTALYVIQVSQSTYIFGLILSSFLFYVCKRVCVLIVQMRYSKTCVKRPLKNRQNKGLTDKW